MDKHFRDAPFEENIPVQLGLASIWNVSFLGYPARAILPYTQALSKLAPHIQQVNTRLGGLVLCCSCCAVCSRLTNPDHKLFDLCTIYSTLACCRDTSTSRISLHVVLL